MKPVLRTAWNILARWWFPLLLVVLWELAIKAGMLDHTFFPAPSSLIAVAWEDLASGRLVKDSIASIERLIAGMTIGVILGVGLGLAMALWKPIDMMLGSLVQIIRAIPPITWIGFSILWFGLGDKPAIFLIVLGVVFPILLNTYAGVKQVDQIYLRAAYNLGARGWMLFKDVILAAALPSVLTGLRVAVGLGWILVVVGELIAVPSGLGNTLMRAQDYAHVDRMLAYMLVIGLFGYLSDILVMRLTRYLLRWQSGIEHA
ncbi:MAG: ABC transporter permease [Rhodobiaceae bacterium]|nr:ABC transporter permease [Rhodobiaceae bacterium]